MGAKLLRDLFESRSIRYTEAKDSDEQIPEGVLGVHEGLGSVIGVENENERTYEEDLWLAVLGDEDIKKRLEARAVFGQLGHPQDQPDPARVSHVTTAHEIREEDGEKQVWVKDHVLDTPHGRILHTLLQAKTGIGRSSRGYGEEKEKKGKKVVDPKTFKFEAYDFVTNPSFVQTIGKQELVASRVVDILQNAVNEGEKFDKKVAVELLEAIDSPKAKVLLESIKSPAKAPAGKDVLEGKVTELAGELTKVSKQLDGKDKDAAEKANVLKGARDAARKRTQLLGNKYEELCRATADIRDRYLEAVRMLGEAEISKSYPLQFQLTVQCNDAEEADGAIRALLDAKTKWIEDAERDGYVIYVTAHSGVEVRDFEREVRDILKKSPMVSLESLKMGEAEVTDASPVGWEVTVWCDDQEEVDDVFRALEIRGGGTDFELEMYKGGVRVRNAKPMDQREFERKVKDALKRGDIRMESLKIKTKCLGEAELYGPWIWQPLVQVRPSRGNEDLFGLASVIQDAHHRDIAEVIQNIDSGEVDVVGMRGVLGKDLLKTVDRILTKAGITVESLKIRANRADEYRKGVGLMKARDLPDEQAVEFAFLFDELKDYQASGDAYEADKVRDEIDMLAVEYGVDLESLYREFESTQWSGRVDERRPNWQSALNQIIDLLEAAFNKLDSAQAKAANADERELAEQIERVGEDVESIQFELNQRIKHSRPGRDSADSDANRVDEQPKIKAKHPGILQVPAGKDISALPLSHFVKLAKSKGLKAISAALINLMRWNKKKNPKLSKWADAMQARVSKAMKKAASVQDAGERLDEAKVRAKPTVVELNITCRNDEEARLVFHNLQREYPDMDVDFASRRRVTAILEVPGVHKAINHQVEEIQDVLRRADIQVEELAWKPPFIEVEKYDKALTESMQKTLEIGEKEQELADANLRLVIADKSLELAPLKDRERALLDSAKSEEDAERLVKEVEALREHDVEVPAHLAEAAAQVLTEEARENRSPEGKVSEEQAKTAGRVAKSLF